MELEEWQKRDWIRENGVDDGVGGGWRSRESLNQVDLNRAGLNRTDVWVA